MKHAKELLGGLATMGTTLLLLGALHSTTAAQTVVATIPVEGRPHNVAVNPATNRIYEISCTTCPPVMTVINGDTNSIVATVTVANEPVAGLAVNPLTNRIYTNRSVVDGATNTVIATLPLGDGGVLAINPQANRLYDMIGRVVDLASNSVVAGIPALFGGQYPEDLAVNTATNRIYMAGRGFLHVIDGSTNTIIQTILHDIDGVPRVTVNSASNRVYLSGNTASAQVKMLVFDGATSVLVTTIPNVRPFYDLDVNEQTNRVYGVNIAFSQLWIIDGSSNTVASVLGVGTETGPRGVAANVQTGAVYTADEIAGTVTVVQDISPKITVEIDIKPGSYPNSINLGSGGTIPVAIFSTADFDATKVDPATVTLASAVVKLKGKGTPMASLQDVNGDGLLDLVVHVSTEALQLSETGTIAVLEGQTFDGRSIQGSDSVRIVQ